MTLGYEVDFLPVGDTRPGDAIALRYGNLNGSRDEQTVVVIDGGYRNDGDVLVEHIAKHYGTDVVDYVISTHPDADHINGLKAVVEKMRVGTLLMHTPETHPPFRWRRSAFAHDANLSEYVTKSLNESESLHALADRLGTRVVEPFAGWTSRDGLLRVLGPSEEYYDAVLRQMRGTEKDLLHGTMSTNEVREMIIKAAAGPPKVVATEREDARTEYLSEQSLVTPSNSSSVICMLEVADHRLLFTGDAGEEALRPVVGALRRSGIVPGGLDFVQIPHHGSRKNVTPSLLDELLGRFTSERRGTAFVSVPPRNHDCQFPSKQVTNAFIRRGYRVLATAGATKRHHRNAPRRGWRRAEEVPFEPVVELFAD
jgi:beta-lactamase superfamily II metal-dependent hydrolase